MGYAPGALTPSSFATVAPDPSVLPAAPPASLSDLLGSSLQAAAREGRIKRGFTNPICNCWVGRLPGGLCTAQRHGTEVAVLHFVCTMQGHSNRIDKCMATALAVRLHCSMVAAASTGCSNISGEVAIVMLGLGNGMGPRCSKLHSMHRAVSHIYLIQTVAVCLTLGSSFLVSLPV